MLKLKITTVGSSAGVILPKEVLARLKVEKGDQLTLVETANGYELSPYDPEFEESDGCRPGGHAQIQECTA